MMAYKARSKTVAYLGVVRIRCRILPSFQCCFCLVNPELGRRSLRGISKYVYCLGSEGGGGERVPSPSPLGAVPVSSCPHYQPVTCNTSVVLGSGFMHGTRQISSHRFFIELLNLQWQRSPIEHEQGCNSVPQKRFYFPHTIFDVLIRINPPQ